MFTQLCIIFRVQSALSGIYITQPRNELYTSTVPLIAKLKPKLIPQHKLNTIIGKHTTMWGSLQSKNLIRNESALKQILGKLFCCFIKPLIFSPCSRFQSLKLPHMIKISCWTPPPPICMHFCSIFRERNNLK